MPSSTSVTLGLALAMLGSLASVAWAATDEDTIVVKITKDMAWGDIAERIQGESVTFHVAEGWDGRGAGCVSLAEGSQWTFLVIDTSGEGTFETTHLPGFSLGAGGSTLDVTGGELGGWCAWADGAVVEDTGEDTGEETGEDTGEEVAVELYAHVISAQSEASVTLTGVALGLDTTGVRVELPRVGLYGLAGSVNVVNQVAVGLPFPAAQLLGAFFTQKGGSYTGGASSAIVSSDSVVSLENVVFVGGRAERGVGVDAQGGVLLVSDTRFEGGEATTVGGAIAALDTVVTLDDVLVSASRAAAGGGVWAQGGVLSIVGGALTGNAASESGGGGVFVEQASVVTISGTTFDGNTAPLGGGLSARSVETLEITDTTLTGDTASIKGGALHLHKVTDARLCGLSMTGVTAAVSGGAVYATDSGLTLGADNGSCAASQISGAVALEGAALSFFDTSDAPDGVGLSAVGLELTQLNPDPDGDDRRITGDEAIFVSTSGALTLSGLSTPGGLGDLALLTASEAVVTLTDLDVRDEQTTSTGQYVAVQQSVIELSRPASVALRGVWICGFVAEAQSEGTPDVVHIDDPAGDVLIDHSALFGVEGFGALVRVVPDDSGLSEAAVTLEHNSLIGAKKGDQDGATIRAGSVVATGNLLHRLDVGLTLIGSFGEAETYNLFSDAVTSPRRDEDGLVVRVDDSSTDKVVSLDLVPAFVDTSCAALPELLETSPAVNGGDPDGARDPDGSIADQGALPVTLNDTDGDGSFDVDDCAPDDPTVGDTVAEVYGDRIDNDCDPTTLDDDEDGDGLLRGLDCDDADPTPCPLVSAYFGGRAAWGCVTAPPFTAAAPRLHWSAPLALLIWRRRRRQGC